MELGEFGVVDLHVETGEQVLEDDSLDDTTFQVVNLLQSLNNLCFLPVEVVHDEAWGDTFLIRACDRLPVKRVFNRLRLARYRCRHRMVRYN